MYPVNTPTQLIDHFFVPLPRPQKGVTNPVIPRNLKVGAEDAEADRLFLENCFVDTGDVAVLRDCGDARCVVLGRTGVGKTALLQRVMKDSHHCVELAPETLALHYITNSNVLQFFEETGVSLEVFYQLLWRHILAVELIKLKYDLKSEAHQRDFFSSIASILERDKGKQRAFNYFQNWGDKFWETTEYRTREFTERLETDLKASVGIDSTIINAGADGARRLTSEQRGEVRQRGTQIVNSVQIKELHDVIEFLAEQIFYGSFDSYYILIDRLDEGWVGDRIRFKLIRALLEAVKSFKKVRNAKIIVALRTDLHYRMLREIKNPSFQEEKYRSLYLPVKWTREQLIQLLDSRVEYLYRRQYTKTRVKLEHIFAATKMDERTPIDYIIERTFFRPREAIIFMNDCLARSEGKTTITVSAIREAEITYSRDRLHALADEWRREYPRIDDTARLLSGRSYPFRLDSISAEECENFAEWFLRDQNYPDDPIQQLCEEYYTGDRADHLHFVRAVFLILYQVGLIGIKAEAGLPRQWSFDDRPTLDEETLKSGTLIYVHKTFWAALEIAVRNGKGRDAD